MLDKVHRPNIIITFEKSNKEINSSQLCQWYVERIFSQCTFAPTNV